MIYLQIYFFIGFLFLGRFLLFRQDVLSDLPEKSPPIVALTVATVSLLFFFAWPLFVLCLIFLILVSDE